MIVCGAVCARIRAARQRAAIVAGVSAKLFGDPFVVRGGGDLEGEAKKDWIQSEGYILLRMVVDEAVTV